MGRVVVLQPDTETEELEAKLVLKEGINGDGIGPLIISDVMELLLPLRPLA